MKTVAFFNAQGAAGKTVLVYNLAWMLADRGEKVLVVDLDPQANLTRALRSESRLEQLWTGSDGLNTIDGVFFAVRNGLTVHSPMREEVDETDFGFGIARLRLLVGDPALLRREEELAEAWLQLGLNESALQRTSAIAQGIRSAANMTQATWILVDTGPGLGAINRAALIASDFVVSAVTPDLLSIHGLRNSGPVFRKWRNRWSEVAKQNPDMPAAGLHGPFPSIGYVVIQHESHEFRAQTRDELWVNRFPQEYRASILGEESPLVNPPAAGDPFCLGILNHYRSLMPMAREARKPLFALRPADGAIGAHVEAVRSAYDDFLTLSRRIAKACGAELN